MNTTKKNISEAKCTKYIKAYLEENKGTEYLSKTWIFDDKQFFTNGFTAFMLKKHIKELPCENRKSKLKELEKITKYIINYCKTEDKILTAFNFDDLNASIKKQEDEHKKYITYDIGKFRYTAYFLMDCVELLGGENLKFYQPKRLNFASLFVSENGKALILPIADTSCHI